MTLNNPEEHESEPFENLTDYQYFILGKEKAASGTYHFQGFFYFKTQQRFSRMKKLNTRAHWEPMKGTPRQAADYCKKDNDFIEHGTLPEQGRRTDLASITEALKTKTLKQLILEGEHGTTIAKYPRGLQLLSDTLSEKKRDSVPNVRWYWGRTGTGKTKAAIEEAKATGPWWMSNRDLKWWQGYEQEENIILDDFRKDFCTFHELLRILDRYEYRVEVKGGHRELLATNIWITTCKHPNDTYDNRGEDLEQLLRRISEIRKFE